MSDRGDLDKIPPEVLMPVAFGRFTVEHARACVEAVGQPVVQIGDSLTLLHQAASFGLVDVIEFLLEAGHPTEVRTVNGETPLDQAAWRGNIGAAVALVAVGGANPNCATHGGYTPLHRAAYYGHARLASLLVLMGADKTIRDGNGDIPFDCAVAQGHDDIAPLIKPELDDHGVDVSGLPYARNNPCHPDHRPEALEAVINLYNMELSLKAAKNPAAADPAAADPAAADPAGEPQPLE